jgi:homoaconitase/3-isopropylmalate dehydratase large subunit
MTPKKNTPTKTDLVQLQKLYKTDEKIGERLGGVPAYLVAYWRRKKNVPKYSLPKFSDRDVLALWERFGDDEKCGLELGISKAAFYNWRRRYGIREKPAFLKLEQLELDFPGVRNAPLSHSLYGEQTIAQKIIARAAGKDRVPVGSIIKVEPDLVSANVGSDGVIEEFLKISQGYVWNAGKIVLTEGASGYSNGAQSVAEFVRRQGIKTVYDLREGHCSQVLLERGHIQPGEMIVGTESSVVAIGCLGSLAFMVEPSKAAKLWASGSIDIQVPATIKIELNGRRVRGVYTRDILAYLVKQLEKTDCTNKVIEFSGLTVSQMNVSERFTLCYLARLVGAKAAVTPYNSTVRRYLTGRASSGLTPVQPDKNAVYEQSLTLDISEVRPLIYAIGKEAKVQPAVEFEGQQVRQVVLGGCPNGRFEDLRVAADILKGEKVHRDCKLFICPASRMVFLEALKKGLIRVFVEAGAVVMNPGADVTLARDESILSKSQPTLSTTINDIKGKQVYYCSPATAAASAINAVITDPARFVRK